MTLINVFGALVGPKGMTNRSTKVIFGFKYCLPLIFLSNMDPRVSTTEINFEKYTDPAIISNMSLSLGIGNLY